MIKCVYVNIKTKKLIIKRYNSVADIQDIPNTHIVKMNKIKEGDTNGKAEKIKESKEGKETAKKTC